MHGATGAWARLLALPVFYVAVRLIRLVGRRLEEAGRSCAGALPAQCAFLALGSSLAIALGPFADADRPAALLTGAVLVVAMAVQNAAHRAHLPEAPPSTVMTGITT
ncbi:DUF1275 family protein [Methylobacterium frigidaeris]|uniref:Uncharacterized protein n=1 Tax=Methylobacterium frigidaeris TaxID=2038277 RepID=A0AA37HHI6_9HYPH|nr:DUF1275 family protein [Methylobacterium frigidaeris]PIK71930.1 hypothetical protein CS379_16760 [Methylobacterium frigidaeris]GJD66003.1 hypothetical protein MPEAHAMD_6199 [Methylobacterium frigidaeris]